MKNCGISRWDDPDKINTQLKALTEQPIWEVNDDYYENVILKYYDEKCKKHKVYRRSEAIYTGRACSTIWLLTNLFLWHLSRPKAPTSTTVTATST